MPATSSVHVCLGCLTSLQCRQHASIESGYHNKADERLKMTAVRIESRRRLEVSISLEHLPTYHTGTTVGAVVMALGDYEKLTGRTRAHSFKS
jgi:hypothetical protein